MSSGYAIEYWPGTRNVKLITSVASEEDVPEGQDFIPEGEPLPTPVEPPPTPEQLLAAARIERDRLLVYATLKIDPLQDAVDLDEATAADIALLKLWKKYRSEVGKTETKPGWPETPQWPVPPVPLETLTNEIEAPSV